MNYLCPFVHLRRFILAVTSVGFALLPVSSPQLELKLFLSAYNDLSASKFFFHIAVDTVYVYSKYLFRKTMS